MLKKNGQIKVTQDPDKGLRKIAEENETEYTVDNLVSDSLKKEEHEEKEDDE
jgi:hypothetical protein